MNAYLNAISYYLPEQVLTNQELAALFPEWGIEKIANKVGISQRHIAADNELASDMAISAAKKLFAEHHIDPKDIDFVLYCTQSPDYFLPSTSCIIQNLLGIPTTAGALDFNLGCSGYIYGLAVAKGLLSASIAKNILLITSDTYTKYIHKNDKSNRTIFGDAASATLIAGTGFAKIGEFVLGTDGKGAENLMVKNGAGRNPDSLAVTSSDEFGNEKSDKNLHMNGPEIFSFTSAEIPGLIEEVLLRNSVLKNDVDLFILHQANKYMLEHLRKKINIPSANFYINMSDTGNTVSSTIPIALSDVIRENHFMPGTKHLLAGYGVGYSWGATIITFD